MLKTKAPLKTYTMLLPPMFRTSFTITRSATTHNAHASSSPNIPLVLLFPPLTFFFLLRPFCYWRVLCRSPNGPPVHRREGNVSREPSRSASTSTDVTRTRTGGRGGGTAPPLFPDRSNPSLSFALNSLRHGVLVFCIQYISSRKRRTALLGVQRGKIDTEKVTTAVTTSCVVGG